LNIIFVVRGNLYNVILSTAVAKAIRSQYPLDNLIIVCEFPEVYIGCGFINRVYKFDAMQYFYTDFIDRKDFIVLDKNPYEDQAYISDKKHIIEAWCSIHQIVYNRELPHVFYSNIERIPYLAKLNVTRPIILFNYATTQDVYCWYQDIPIEIAYRLVKDFSKDYDILIVSDKVIWELENVQYINPTYKDLVYLTSIATQIITVNSVLHLIATALSKKCTVCWNIDNYMQFAFDVNANIVGLPPKSKVNFEDAYIDKYQGVKKYPEIPYVSTSEIFDAMSIAKSVLQFKAGFYLENFIENNIHLRSKIFAGISKLKMVSLRLYHLLRIVDLSNVECILDIGSCNLEQSLEFAELFEKANIYAFEPVSESFKKCENIRNTLEVATRSRIHIHNLAISDFEGQIDFYPVDANLSSVPNVGASSMFQFIEGLNGTMFGQNLVQNHEIAQSTTLDLWSNTMEFKEIDIIWLDVQGAELLVFKGGIETLKKTKVILTEVGIKPYYKNHTLKPEIDTLLTEIGFEEVSEAFQFNGFDYEANTIYVNKKFKL